MNRFITPIFAVLALAAAAFAWFQYDSAAKLRQQIGSFAAEHDQNQKAQAEIDRLKAAAGIAQENIARLTAERDAALARAKSLPPGPPSLPGTPPPGVEKGGNGMMQGIAKMFSTEEGRKMMRSQMNAGLKMQYGDLAKHLKLDPKTADQVLALLGDRQAALTEATFAAMKDGTLDDAAGKELATKAQATQSDYNDKLRAIIGDDGLTQLQGYERTLGDRMMLNMHAQQFSDAGAVLDDTQRDSLLQIMQTERMKTPASAFDTNNSGNPGQTFAALRDDAAVENWLVQEQDYQRRVLQTATQTLNPDQVAALQESFKQQLEMQKFGVTMSKQMFNGSGTQATTTITVAPSATPGTPAK
jgi:hypothetical protein